MSMRQQKIADNVISLLNRLGDAEKYCEMILGYSQKKSLDNNPPENLLETRKKILDMIYSANSRVASLTNEMVDNLYEAGIRW